MGSESKYRLSDPDQRVKNQIRMLKSKTLTACEARPLQLLGNGASDSYLPGYPIPLDTNSYPDLYQHDPDPQTCTPPICMMAGR